jgi:hypothetical protein
LGGLGGGLDFYESVLLTSDKTREKLQMCRCKLLDILLSVDVTAASRAVLSVLLISSCLRLGSQTTWSVFGPVYVFCNFMFV